MFIFQRCNYFMSISKARSFNDFNYLLLHITSKSNQSHMVYKIGVLKNFIKFIGKQLFWIVFLGLRNATLPKERIQHRCFPANIMKFFKNTFFTEKSQGECFCIFFKIVSNRSILIFFGVFLI